MQPPICELCGTKFSEGGKLVYFKRTPGDEEWYKLAEKPGFTGHPPNAAWFCEEHLAAAENLREIYFSDAIKALRKSMDEGRIGSDLIRRLKDFLSNEEEE